MVGSRECKTDQGHECSAQGGRELRQARRDHARDRPRARAAAHALALAPAAQKNRALAAMAKAIRAARAAILAANAEDVAEAKSAGATAAFLDRLTLDAQRIEAMADGLDVIRKLEGSGRHRLGVVAAPQRHAHRARARAARRRRRHLREPAQCHRRCRRAVPQGRQCRDPARRFRELPFDAAPSMPRWSRVSSPPTCRPPPSRWCRRASAPPSA